MHVLLISTYELGHQPLGLAGPLSHLRAAGFVARGVDTAVEHLPDSAITDADFVGISVPMHTALRLGVQVAARVRQLAPQAHICFYGLYAALNQEYLLRGHADSIVGGEAEAALIQVARSHASRGAAPPARSVIDLGRHAALPPDRDGLPPLDRYARLDLHGEERLVGCVETSRGCAHQCLHCPITPVYGGRLRIVPLDVVLADVRHLVAMGAQHLTFADPDFFNGVRHSMRVLRAIHAEFPALTFDATIKVEHVIEHQALLEELRDLGCAFIVSAVESLSDRVLTALRKGHTSADVATALTLAHEAGIPVRPTLLPFTPWATLDDYLDLFDFVEAHGLLYHIEPVQYAIRLLVPPGSGLLGSPLMRPHLGALDEENFAHTWTHPDPRMDALAAEAVRIVEDAARRGADTAETFAALRDAAVCAGGVRRAAPRPPVAVTGRAHPPRLTEPWFC